MIYSYLCKYKYRSIRYRIDEPYLLDIPDVRYDLEESVCVKVEEVIPNDAPDPLGKQAITISYNYANLNHSVIDSVSITGVMHFVIKNPG